MSAEQAQTMERKPSMSRRSSHLRNTWHLGVKEFHSLARDMALLFLIVFMFSVSIYADARAKPESLNRASIAVVDEDHSQLSTRIVAALQPPQFITPEQVVLADMDRGMDAGRHTFVLDIPPGFQRDVLAARSPALQLNVDATRQSQAQTGAKHQPLLALFAEPAAPAAWLQRHQARLAPLDRAQVAARMLARNPKFVLRNHLAELAIQAARSKDFSVLRRLQTVLEAPFDEHPGHDDLAALPPDWARQIAISCSS